MCTDKSSVVQRFSFLPLLWGNPLSKLGAEGWEGLPDKWAGREALATNHTLFCVCLNCLWIWSVFHFPENLPWNLLQLSPVWDRSGRTWPLPEPRGVLESLGLGKAMQWPSASSSSCWARQGQGLSGRQWIFCHLCLCCLMSLFWFCFLKKIIFILF